MATHSSILAWKIPWTEEPAGLQSLGLQNSWTQLSDRAHTHLVSKEHLAFLVEKNVFLGSF